jgi:hypothetical protein
MMTTIKKYPLEAFAVIGPLSNHSELKASILNSIANDKQDELVAVDDYYTDAISKLDWSNAKDFTRPWVQILKPSIDQYLNDLAEQLGYQKAIIEEFWFQQYIKGNTHGWHTHGSNFTGVYYLEFDTDSPTTELIEPNTQSRKIVPNVKEGDIIIFPSFTIHRAPEITNDIRKTIVSFNFILDLIHPEMLKHLNNL